jgi:hypothetical protein
MRKREIAIGYFLMLILMKERIGDESRILPIKFSLQPDSVDLLMARVIIF